MKNYYFSCLFVSFTHTLSILFGNFFSRIFPFNWFKWGRRRTHGKKSCTWMREKRSSSDTLRDQKCSNESKCARIRELRDALQRPFTIAWNQAHSHTHIYCDSPLMRQTVTVFCCSFDSTTKKCIHISLNLHTCIRYLRFSVIYDDEIAWNFSYSQMCTFSISPSVSSGGSFIL